jgi:flagellar basal-body rod protein FlgG
MLEPQIQIPPDQIGITIGEDGSVSVSQAGQSQPASVGKIELALFPNPSGLQNIGKSLFVSSQASGDAIVGTAGENGLGTLMSGYVEQSNVSIVEEMVNMIVSQRAYEANSKVIKTADEMFTQANQVIR